MMEKAIEHGGDGRTVSQQFAPVFHRSVGSEQSTGTFIASHDDLQEFLGGGDGQIAHAQIIDRRDPQGTDGTVVFMAATCRLVVP